MLPLPLTAPKHPPAPHRRPISRRPRDPLPPAPLDIIEDAATTSSHTCPVAPGLHGVDDVVEGGGSDLVADGRAGAEPGCGEASGLDDFSVAYHFVGGHLAGDGYERCGVVFGVGVSSSAASGFLKRQQGLAVV